MKKSLTIAALLLVSKLTALPIGNPSEPSLLTDGIVYMGGKPYGVCNEDISVRFGFYGDYVFNRHMETSIEGIDKEISRIKMCTNAGYFALNFWNKVDVFSTLGTSHFLLHTDGEAFSPSVAGIQIVAESSTSFSWSVGGRATLFEMCSTALGVEGQYFSTRPHIYRSTIGNLFTIYDVAGSHYREWQIGLGVSHQIGKFVPYVAAKWAQALWEVETTPNPIKSKKQFGYAAGVTFISCERAALTTEVRFADEKALYVNGQIRF